LGFPTGWLFTTHKDSLLHINKGSALPSVLWSLRTTPNAATQETPFFLVHDAEAVLLVEITHEAPRIAAYDKTTSTKALQDDVDALDEARDVALARATQY
jgi:hypothetical protein